MEEGQHELEKHDNGPVLDLMIMASQQRIKPYKAAAHGTMVAWCKALKRHEVVDLFATTLAEERLWISATRT